MNSTSCSLISLRQSYLFCLAAVVIPSVGCEKSTTGAYSGKLIQVAGYVRLNSTPVPVGTVVYYPDPARGNQNTEQCRGTILEDGSYKLQTSGKDGAPPGWYKVIVQPTGMPKEMPPIGQPMPKAPTFDVKYQKPETSGIVIEVKEGAPVGTYDINLK
jgi:hypothetical protein